MKMKSLCLIATFPLLVQGQELSQKEKDRHAILAMAGTYVVDFHFKETAAFEMGYELKDAYDAAALEIVIPIEQSENKIVLQHVLETKRGIIKHWRQDWEYENTVLWEYQGDRVWKKRDLNPVEVKGTWTQRVFQVDDSPRYEAIGRWTHVGNLSQWESGHTNRPLPRREYTKRDDYNILVSKNRHTLTPTGWIHEQDNFKLRRVSGTDHVLARELGLNRYDYTQPEKCAEARNWWDNHQAFWRDVRDIWAEIFDDRKEIVLEKAIGEKPLYRHLFDLAEESCKTGGYASKTFKSRALDIIAQFLVGQKNGTGP